MNLESVQFLWEEFHKSYDIKVDSQASLRTASLPADLMVRWWCGRWARIMSRHVNSRVASKYLGVLITAAGRVPVTRVLFRPTCILIEWRVIAMLSCRHVRQPKCFFSRRLSTARHANSPSNGPLEWKLDPTELYVHVFAEWANASFLESLVLIPPLQHWSLYYAVPVVFEQAHSFVHTFVVADVL